MTVIKKDFRYPICRIMYKIENTPGWFMAEKSGTIDECNKFCEDLKAKGKLYDYECRVDRRSCEKIDIPMQKFKLDAYDLHMRSCIIFNPYEEKYYNPDEVMPYPTQYLPCCARKFSINVKVAPEEDKDGYLNRFEQKRDFNNITAMLYINKIDIFVIAKYVVEDIPTFLKNLEKDGYSYLYIEEYRYIKLLAWKKDDKIRLIVQSYDDEVEILFDKLIKKDLFFSEFNKLYENLKKGIKRAKVLFNKFKSEENFLKDLPWTIDKNNLEILQEYINLNDKSAKSIKFKNFVEKVSKYSEMHSIDYNTKERDFCMHQEDYYYKIKDNKLIRFFYLTRIRDEIKRYIEIYGIKMHSNTKLIDLFNEVIANGGRQAIECYLNKNKAIIYENGDIIAPLSTEDEIKELNTVIREIVKEKKTNKFSVDEFCNLLRDKGIDTSSYWSFTSMCIKEDK